MKIKRNLQFLVSIFTFASLILCKSSCDASTWISLNNNPTDPVTNPLLQTDGTILVQGSNPTTSQHIWKLTPDAFGNYANGTWSQLASLPIISGTQYAPLGHASAVLADGRIIFIGGEYNGNVNDWTNLGAVYHPRIDTWTALAPPSFFPTRIGDAPSIVLPDGTFMLGSTQDKQGALLDPQTLTWSPANMTGKFDVSDEEGWVLLPNGNVLTVDCGVFTGEKSPATTAEYYNFPGGGWTRTTNTPVSLSDKGFETGASVLMADGNVLAIGANGNSAIYDYQTNLWTVGPTLPIMNGQQLCMADGTAALLPNGNVVFGASPLDAELDADKPVHIFEYDGTNFVQQTDMPGSSNNSSAVLNMLVLPSGQILVTHQSPGVKIYVPTGTYDPIWQPQILNTANNVTANNTYRIDGTLFNGMSQGGMYGDDFQMATNYPIVRITNQVTNHVFYCRTHDHSSMAVAAVGVPVYTYYDVPANIESGYSMLEVVANGIPSALFPIVVNPNVTPAATATPSSQTIKSRSSTNIVFTSTISGTTFSWPAPSQTNASGGGAGTGSTLIQTLTATSTSQGKVIYTITPTANGIQGKPITVTITVNP